MNKIKMYWWNEEPNFGDALNPLLLEKLFKIKTQWADLSTANLVGAGSCLQWVAKAVNEYPHDIIVWGTGYIFDKEPPVNCDQVNHIAVRGKKSKEYGDLQDDIVLGDPGLLASLLFEKQVAKKHKVGVVPHLWNINDEALHTSVINRHDVIIIDVRKDALEVIKQIAECDFIFSSSLHGLIIADSFGIPNKWVTFNKVPFGGKWKFLDYYSVFNMKIPVATTFEESMLEDSFIINLKDNFSERVEIEKIKHNLLEALAKALN